MNDLYRRGIRIVVAGGLVAGAMAFGWAPSAAADWLGDESHLTTGPANWPQLSGTNLVYADHSAERTVGADGATETLFDIRVLSLKTDRVQNLTPAHTALGRPAISGAKVVWSDYGTGPDQGIWYHNLASGKQRRLGASPGAQVQISGDRVCYQYLGRIHVFNIGTGRDLVISPAGSTASSCDISGRIVVWQERRTGHDSDIYAYNLATRRETRLTSDDAEQSLPRIDQNLVVWQQESGANIDIYASDLVTGKDTRVTDDDSVQWFPDVADGRIVWMDERSSHNNTEIYLYDTASGVETRVTDHDGWSGNPTVAGDRIAYEDSRGDGRILFLRRVTPPRLSLAADSNRMRPTVTGRLLGADGRPVADETVSLEVSAGRGDWLPAGTAVTTHGGRFTSSLTARATEIRVRARFAGTPEYPAAVSPELALAGAGVALGPRGPQL